MENLKQLRNHIESGYRNRTTNLQKQDPYSKKLKTNALVWSTPSEYFPPICCSISKPTSKWTLISWIELSRKWKLPLPFYFTCRILVPPFVIRALAYFPKQSSSGVRPHSHKLNLTWHLQGGAQIAAFFLHLLLTFFLLYIFLTILKWTSCKYSFIVSFKNGKYESGNCGDSLCGSQQLWLKTHSASYFNLAQTEVCFTVKIQRATLKPSHLIFKKGLVLVN